MIRTVGAEVAAFVGEAPQGDDITMLALRYLA
jgi:serine phosphatase RsbU (regulator of sigma subunit)